MNDRILIAGGGTGGHIYPAVAVAQKIKKINPNVEVDFVGTVLGLEKKIIPREGFPLYFIKAAALNNVGLFSKIFSLLILPWGIFQSLILILKLKPRVVFGVGGYASGPMMLAAILLRKPTVVFESNAHPGFTNRWLAKFVDHAFVNFEASKLFFKKSEVVGFPVREGMNLSSEGKRRERGENKLNEVKFRVLIFGGSQGARGINQIVLAAMKTRDPRLENYEFVHQIGATDWKYYEEEYGRLNLRNVEKFEFLYDMPERYNWADLIVCRAGAATLAELAFCKKAAILIPFPFASDNHQQKNAEALERGHAAKVLIQKDLSVEKFIETLEAFRTQPRLLEEFENNIPAFFKPGAAEKMAQELLTH